MKTCFRYACKAYIFWRYFKHYACGLKLRDQALNHIGDLIKYIKVLTLEVVEEKRKYFAKMFQLLEVIDCGNILIDSKKLTYLINIKLLFISNRLLPALHTRKCYPTESTKVQVQLLSAFIIQISIFIWN